ncbi:MAG: PAS domain S-box protein [Myxococcales bacterium]|nr:PAS domain S-box protein [Myxococcales bacterium]
MRSPLGHGDHLGESQSAPSHFSREQLALQVLEKAPVVIVVLDLDGRIEFLNAFCERLTGYELADVRGELWFERFIPERIRGSLQEVWESSRSGAHVRANVNPILTRSGEERIIEWSDEFVHGPDGAITGIVAIGHDVTERERAVEALKVSEQRVREAHQIASIGAWEVDLQSGQNWWSDVQYAISGIDLAEPTSQATFWQQVHPGDRERVEKAYQTLLEGGPYECEFRICRPDGEERILHGRASAMRDSTGCVRRIVGTNQDITECARTEERYRATGRQLSAILDNITDGFFTLDHEWRVTYVNPSAARRLLTTPEAMLGRTFQECWQSPLDAAWTSTHLQVMRTGQRETILEYYRPQGRWFEADLFPGSNGLSVIFRDVTSREEAQQQLLKERERLREAQQIAKLGSWELDLVSGELSWSDEIFRIFEIDPAHFDASYEAFLALVHPEDRASVDKSYKDSVEGRLPYASTHRLLMPDGRMKWVEERGQNHYDDELKPLRTAGTVLDITAQVQGERRLRNILDGIFAFVAVMDLQGHIIELNQAPLDLIGMKREDVLGLRAWESPWWSHSEVSRQQVQRVFELAAAGHVSREDFLAKLREGLFVNVDAMFAPLRGACGRIEGVISSGVDVTDRVAAEQRVREQADRLDDAQRVGKLGSLDWDLGTGTIVVSKQTRRMYGLAPEGESPAAAYLLSRIPPEDRERVQLELRDALKGRSRYDLEHRIIQEGGNVIDVHATAEIVLDVAGKPARLLGTIADITERKQADERLRRKSELLQTVMRGAPVAIFALDTQFRFRFSEGRALQAIGLLPGELVGESILDRYGPSELLESALHRALSGESLTLTVGVDHIFDVALAPSCDSQGIVDGIIGVALDVTDRARAEAAIHERDARLAAVFEHASDALVLFSRDAVGGWWVAAANRVMAQRAQTVDPARKVPLVGHTMDELARYVYVDAPDELALLPERIQLVLDTHTPLVFEHVIPRRSGGVYNAEVTLIPVLDADGTCSQIVWSGRDITLRKQADDILRASLAEKETLLREIHHRVKNNLQVIAGLLHFHSKKLHRPEDMASFADLRRRVFAMTLLHERLYRSKDLTRVSFGDYLCDLVAELSTSSMPRTGIGLEVSADDIRLPIEIAMPAGMIVSELVTNVLKYAFPGGRTGRTLVSVRAEGNKVVIGVDDDGIGFPDGFQPDRGDSFGWELVRTLTMQLDGEVEAWTDQGAHTRVSFEIPAAPECGSN